ncbi:MAG: BCAM0308 family protein [Usitatibacter sp.]
MKTERPSVRKGRKAQGLAENRDDSYLAGAKFPDPAYCPRCRATYVKGRWTWGKAVEGAPPHKCPACQRIEDRFPAGYLTLKGPFFAAHRREVLDIVASREQRARTDHPMQRIISVEDVEQGVIVTTTDGHLARSIGVAIHDAFKGDLDLSFAKDENLVRATWSR